MVNDVSLAIAYSANESRFSWKLPVHFLEKAPATEKR